MKVLVYIDQEAVDWVNGNPRVVALINSLKKSRYSVSVATRLSRQSSSTKKVLSQTKVFCLKKSFFSSLKTIFSIKKNHDIIIAIHLYAGFVTAFTKKNFVYDCMELHAELENSFFGKKIIELIERFIFFRSKNVVVVSEERRNFLSEKYFFEKNNVRSITVNNFVESFENTIDRSFQNAFLKQHGISRKQRLYVYIGSIKRSRGIDVLVNAFSRVALSDERLVIIGDDSGGILSKSSQNVVFAGRLSQDELISLRPLFSVGIIALKNVNKNNYYAASFKFSEYLNYGYALIAPDFPVYQKLITLQMGVLCDFNSEKSVQKAVVSLQQRNILQIQTHNKQLSKKYSWDKEFLKYKEFLEIYYESISN